MVKRARVADVSLQGLDAATAELFAERDHELLEFRELDLSGRLLFDARFLECAIVDCRLDDVGLRGARLVDCLLDRLHGTAVDAGNSALRNVIATDCRLGALALHGGTIEQVRLSGGKIDYLNARGAQLTDVEFEGCRVSELDLSGATLTRVSFSRCQLDRLELASAELHDVDLSRATLREVVDVGALAGAAISEEQLHELAPALADRLRIEVVRQS